MSKCVCDWYDSDICLHCKKLLRKSEEETLMETNKHGVIYSEIQVGDLVQIDFEGNLNDTCLGYVTEVTDKRLWAIWSDDFEEAGESFSSGNIIGHWKVVDFRKVPTNPYKQLIAYKSRLHGGLTWGVYSHSKGASHYAYWNNTFQNGKGTYTGYLRSEDIVAVEDIIIHEEKPKAFTFSDFDASVKRTWKDQNFKDAVSNAALGLTGEAGEVADLIKKAIYHKRGFLEVHTLLPEEEDRALSVQDVKDELSDVLYYVSATAQEFGFTLEDVAKHNKEKLEKRFPEGFSTEASAQKADRTPIAFAKPIVSEETPKHPTEFPYYAEVIGDSEDNPTGFYHGLNIGEVVEVTGVSKRSRKAVLADGLTVFLKDLKYIPKHEEATTLKISKSLFTDQQRLDVSTWYTWIPEGENWLEKIKELRVGETFESIDCHDTRHTFKKQPYGLVTMEYQELDIDHEEVVGESRKIENIKVIEEVQK